MRRLRGIGLLAVAGAVACPAVAGAIADDPAVIHARDDAGDYRWDPDAVTVAAGSTVEWRFDQAATTHSIYVFGASGTVFGPEYHSPGGATTYSFDTPGEYTYVCTVGGHADMRGTLTVTAATPTPTPTPSATPTATPTTPSVVPVPGTTPAPIATPAPLPAARDTIAPRLRRVAVSKRKRGLRVSFRLSERATVTVTAKRSGRRAVRRTRSLGAGARSIALALPAGRYRIAVSGRDAGGNRSTTRHLDFTVRR